MPRQSVHRIWQTPVTNMAPIDDFKWVCPRKMLFTETAELFMNAPGYPRPQACQLLLVIILV